MKEAKERIFGFDTTFTSKYGETVTIKTSYKVHFRRYNDSNYTYIGIEPQYGVPHRLQIEDCGITWKSLFFAYQWCSKHVAGSRDRQVRDIFQGNDDSHLWGFDGDDVIPDIKFSTGSRPIADV